MSSSSLESLNDEEIITAKLRKAFRGSEYKIDEFILPLWPHPRTFESFLQVFSNGDPPPALIDAGIDPEDYKQIKSVIFGMVILRNEKQIDQIQKKLDKMDRESFILAVFVFVMGSLQTIITLLWSQDLRPIVQVIPTVIALTVIFIYLIYRRS